MTNERPIARPISPNNGLITAIVAQVIAAFIIPGGPLLMMTLAIFTPLRRSRWRMVVLIGSGIILGGISLAPWISRALH